MVSFNEVGVAMVEMAAVTGVTVSKLTGFPRGQRDGILLCPGSRA